jgi:hypothetical protein
VSEHTTTPWKVDPFSDETIAICTADESVHVCILEKRDAADGECSREADAAFIVEAVNNHAALVAACQAAQSELEEISAFTHVEKCALREQELASIRVVIHQLRCALEPKP